MRKQVLITLSFLLTIFFVNAQINIDTVTFYSASKHLNFNNENVVVVGEAHSLKGTFDVEFFLIKNFAEKGYKTIYLEAGESEAAIMNMFLKTGDTSVLQYTRARSWGGAYKFFLESIRQLNIEKGYELTFKGFDFERPICVGYLFSKWLGDLKINTLDFKKLSDDLLALNGYQSFDKKNRSKLKAVFDSVKVSFAKNENQYREILQGNFYSFKKIIFDPFTTWDSRDENFVKSMLQIDKEAGLNKSIIIVGNLHVLFKNKFISVLSDSLSEKYSIFCFPLIYSNCVNLAGGKKYTSYPQFLSNKKEKRSLIYFTKAEKRIIPSINENLFTVFVELYNQ